MTKAQTKLIKQAATKEVDGEGFRQRMDAWLDWQSPVLFLEYKLDPFFLALNGYPDAYYYGHTYY